MSCIALTGLGGHAFGSWCSTDKQSTFMWLRDAIPRRHPDIRIITYGYDTELTGNQSFQTIEDISLSFIRKLSSVGLFEPSSKPVIFIAHSLGGIIIKQAILLMVNSPAFEISPLLKISKNIFFGVPNRGMKVAHLLPMVKHNPDEQLTQALREESPYLATLDQQFSGICLTSDMGIVSIYETHKSQIPQPKQHEDGKWHRSGLYEVLVNRESAVQNGTRDSERYPINKDHSGLVKFSEADDDLITVLHILRPDLRSVVSKNPVDHNHFLVRSQQTISNLSVVRKTVENDLQLQKVLYAGQHITKQQFHDIQSMLKSLSAEPYDHRFFEVEEAYSSTFGWVLGHKTGLKEWLRAGNGTFWIKGKPGSGKSTVMKYVYHKHIEAMKDRHEPTPQFSDTLTARFFFSQRGSRLQKSYEGLLRSIVHQILTQSEYLALTCLPTWLLLKPGTDIELSPNLLEMLWKCILDQKKRKSVITLFLDALDEYDGPMQKIIQFVKHACGPWPLSVQTELRVCFASRSWDIFQDQFGSSPGFLMELFTRNDIENYVTKTLTGHQAMQSLVHSKIPAEVTAVTSMISVILKQADGVFVWVRTVINDILEARSAGADVEDLQLILVNLPNELEDLYAALLLRVKSSNYRREAYLMLELLLRSPRALLTWEFRLIMKCAMCSDLDEGVSILSKQRQDMSEDESDVLRRRIRSRCGGLLEVVEQRNTSSSEHVVQFMHQTAKDFVARLGFKSLFHAQSQDILIDNGHTILSKFGMIMIKSAYLDVKKRPSSRLPWLGPIDTKSLWDLCAPSFAKAETTTGLAHLTLLNTLSTQNFIAFFGQSRYSSSPDFMRYFRPRMWPVCSLITFAIMADMQICFESQLPHLDGTNQIPLLQLIVERVQSGLRIGNPIPYVIALLQRIGGINELFEGMTPFQALFRSMNPTGWDYVSELGKDLIEVFLRHGSDPNSDLYWLENGMQLLHHDPAPYTSKPMHVAVANPAVLKLLLKYGADINARNAEGLTVLDDIAIRICQHAESPFKKQVLTAAKIIIQAGGSITDATVDSHHLFALNDDRPNWKALNDEEEYDSDSSAGSDTDRVSNDTLAFPTNPSLPSDRVAGLCRALREWGHKKTATKFLASPVLPAIPSDIEELRQQVRTIRPHTPCYRAPSSLLWSSGDLI